MLVRASQPGVLPSNGHVVEVPAVADIGSPVVTGFDGLVLADWN